LQAVVLLQVLNRPFDRNNIFQCLRRFRYVANVLEVVGILPVVIRNLISVCPNRDWSTGAIAITF
jgi:hypothetical protein